MSKMKNTPHTQFRQNKKKSGPKMVHCDEISVLCLAECSSWRCPTTLSLSAWRSAQQTLWQASATTCCTIPLVPRRSRTDSSTIRKIRKRRCGNDWPSTTPTWRRSQIITWTPSTLSLTKTRTRCLSVWRVWRSNPCQNATEKVWGTLCSWQLSGLKYRCKLMLFSFLSLPFAQWYPLFQCLNKCFRNDFS